MVDKPDKPQIDEVGLDKKATADPKSKKWNNKKSRSNLKQYQEEKVVAKLVSEDDEEDDSHVSAIVVGRKLSPELVKKLMPQRGVLTAAEKKRYVGIVQQYLADFKREEPTAADIDDIFEIAESDIMKTRLLQISKGEPEVLVTIQQSMERIYKRKQTARENLASRRVDRRDNRSSQDISIVDLVVVYDLDKQREDEERVASLLEDEEVAAARLEEVLEKDGY